MKQLLLLRHAKSSWKDPGMTDHDRPLNPRGKRDAPRVGQLLRERDLVPDLIISSTAKRARKTASKVAKGCGYEGVIELRGELYLASPHVYYEVTRQVPDDWNRVMIIGHNPGIADWLDMMTGELLRFPTAALAEISLQLERWRDLGQGVAAELTWVWYPKEGDVVEE